MKVLHIISGLKLSYLGGVSTYVRSLAAEQAKQGYEVAIYGSADDNMPYKFFECNTSKYLPFSRNKMIDEKLIEDLRGWLEQEQFDIIHIHSAFLLPWNVYRVLQPYKYIISLHDYYYLCPRGAVMVDWQGNVCRKLDLHHCQRCISRLDLCIEKMWLLRKTFNFLCRIFKIDLLSRLPRISQCLTDDRYQAMRTLLNNAALLLPASHRTRKIYQEAGIENDYHVVHIGNNSALRYSLDYPLSPVRDDGKIHVAMIGEMSYIKGADIFLEIVMSSRRDDIQFHFWGKCVSNYYDKLRRAGVLNHGTYKHDDLPNILKTIDLAIVPPICEDAGPQVIMELLNSHVPIMTTGRGGIADFINENNGYVFDTEQIATGIDFINTLDVNRINSYRKKITRTKTPKEHFEELHSIYTNLLNDTSSHKSK